jgi:hypothetical protein
MHDLADFIVAPQPTQSDTPLSNSNGYTSEESDYSVVTPSDEQNYQDMSFLQTADTSELVDVVAGLSPALTAVPPQHQQQQKFAGKVIKGKVRAAPLCSLQLRSFLHDKPCRAWFFVVSDAAGLFSVDLQVSRRDADEQDLVGRQVQCQAHHQHVQDARGSRSRL